jgi:hypothetical protein
VRLERIKSIEKSNDLIRIRTRDLLAFSIVPQPTTLRRAPPRPIIDVKCKVLVKWVPCHHGMARPQAAERGNGLQIWRVAVVILNNQ